MSEIIDFNLSHIPLQSSVETCQYQNKEKEMNGLGKHMMTGCVSIPPGLLSSVAIFTHQD